MHLVEDDRYELLREETSDEMRVVSFEIGEEGEARIKERTDGELTLAIFDCLWRVRSITVPGDRVDDLSDALPRSGTGSLVDRLQRFFSPGTFLSDLQDLLDREKVPYASHTQHGALIAMRRP